MHNLKQGDMVLTSTGEREFIARTANNNYLCWSEGKTSAYSWDTVTKIEPVVYYFQYEKLYTNMHISITQHVTDSNAKELTYTRRMAGIRLKNLNVRGSIKVKDINVSKVINYSSKCYRQHR